jgi:hypothetical protein
MPAKVQRVTPSGQVTARIGDDPKCDRVFSPKGKETRNAYPYYELDPLPFEERKAMVERGKRARAAADALAEVAVKGSPRGEWGKDNLEVEAARLQGLLDAAKALIQAI